MFDDGSFPNSDLLKTVQMGVGYPCSKSRQLPGISARTLGIVTKSADNTDDDMFNEQHSLSKYMQYRMFSRF